MNVLTPYHVRPFLTADAESLCGGVQASLAEGDQSPLPRLEIVTLPHNVASQRVAESLGATRECLARHRLVVGGTPRDAIVYSLVPQDAGAWSSVP